MRIPKPINNLITEFQKLPGIGPRTAERLTYFLLRMPREDVLALTEALNRLKGDVVECRVCFNIDVISPCAICTHPDRDSSKILVVEEPLDLIAIEKTGRYRGLYHVLGGVLNPIAGIGPGELRIDELLERIKKLLFDSGDELEVILATNPSAEGEATAMFLAQKIGRLVEPGSRLVKITRIARGLPTGADVEYADSITLTRALEGRTRFPYPGNSGGGEKL